MNTLARILFRLSVLCGYRLTLELPAAWLLRGRPQRLPRYLILVGR